MEGTLVQSRLDDRISSLHAQFSRKQKRLARFILDNKYFISFASANEAGNRTSMSAATVVRFAQTLGFEGYSEMQAAIRSELPSYMLAIERIQSRIQNAQEPDDFPQSIFRLDIQNIQRTANNLSMEKINSAVETVLQAKRILIVSVGISASAGNFFTHSLKIIGLDARLICSEGIAMSADLAQLRSDDLVIAIDMWRYARSTINAIKKAKSMGVAVITITDSIVSPLAQNADYAFEVATDGISHSLSVTALMSLLNVFVAALSYRIPEATMQSLSRIDRAYRENDLLVLE